MVRARREQAGMTVRCWSCGGQVPVPYPRVTGRLARAFADAVRGTLRAETVGVVLGGAAVVTAALLVPGAGPWLALGLIGAAAVWGYGALVVGARPEAPAGAGGPDGAPGEPAGEGRAGRGVPGVVGRLLLGGAAAVALVAPLIARNGGHLLPPIEPVTGAFRLMLLTLLGGLVVPVALLATFAHDRRGRLPAGLALAALRRHKAATLAALLVVPLGLLLVEGVVAFVAWDGDYLPILVADLFPTPRLEARDDGMYAITRYDGAVGEQHLVGGIGDLNRAYACALRRGFTLVGEVPASLALGQMPRAASVAFLDKTPLLYAVKPAPYLAFRLLLSVMILTSAGLLLAVQARWLGLIAALDPRRPPVARLTPAAGGWPPTPSFDGGSRQ
jgi:hypothetical protein